MEALYNTMTLPVANYEEGTLDMVEVETPEHAFMLIEESGYDVDMTCGMIETVGTFFKEESPSDYSYELVEKVERKCLAFVKDCFQLDYLNDLYFSMRGTMYL